MRILCNILPLLLIALLSACLLVDDFGDAWREAKPDTCLNKIAQSLYAGEFNRDVGDYKIEDIARGWTVDGQNFLLLKKAPGDKGGRLYRFRVINGIFERFRLVPTMHAQFKKDYPHAPVSLKRDTVTLADLSTASHELLVSIANKPEYWEVEDKILYNVMANPACRFEDRDLTTLDDQPRKKK